jgi:hypothetical protein
VFNGEGGTQMQKKITAADVVAGRATPADYVAQLNVAEATAAAIGTARGMMDKEGASLDVAGLTACTVVPQADVASVRAVLEGRAALVG